MIDFCLVCGKRHPGAVRGGKLPKVPSACRAAQLGMVRQRNGSHIRRCPCGTLAKGPHLTTCPQWLSARALEAAGG